MMNRLYHELCLHPSKLFMQAIKFLTDLSEVMSCYDCYHRQFSEGQVR